MTSSDEYSMTVELLEYNRIPGMITYADYTKSVIKSKKGKKSKNMKAVEKLWTIEVYLVTRVDPKGGFMDLAKDGITPEVTKMVVMKHEKGKSIQSLMISLCGKLKMKIEDLYKMIVFPLQMSNEHAFDVINRNIFEIEKIIAPLKLPDELATAVIETIKTRYTPKSLKIKAIFELKTNSKNGILDIKKVLIAAKEFSTPETNLQIVLEATPYYSISTVTSNKIQAVELIEKCLKFIQENIQKQTEGEFELKSFNKENKEEDEEYAGLVQLNASMDKRSFYEEDNDEGMGNVEEFKFD